MHTLIAAFDQELEQLVAQSGSILLYFVVWGLVFAGTGLLLGAFIPFITGDTLLFSAGLVAAQMTQVSVPLLVVGVGIAAAGGDQLGYYLGRKFGSAYLDAQESPFLRRAIARSESFYRVYGWWAVLVARFIPWGRVFVPVIAGVSKMSRPKFISSNLLGAVLWGVGLTLTGYYAAAIPQVKSVAYVIAGVVIAASIVAGIRAHRIEADR